MKTRIRILHWLKLPLLPEGFAGWSRRARQDIWFRRCEMPPGNNKTEIKKYNKIRINIIRMESRLRILRWLSLLLLSAGLVGWSQRVSQGALFRWRYKKQDYNSIFSLRDFKQILQTFKRTVEIQLKIMHWISLLLLSEGTTLQSQNLAHFSWFRRA